MKEEESRMQHLETQTAEEAEVDLLVTNFIAIINRYYEDNHDRLCSDCLHAVITRALHLMVSIAEHEAKKAIEGRA
jgi:hypothetical protein